MVCLVKRSSARSVRGLPPLLVAAASSTRYAGRQARWPACTSSWHHAAHCMLTCCVVSTDASAKCSLTSVVTCAQQQASAMMMSMLGRTTAAC
jgi:hypothetical protein